MATCRWRAAKSGRLGFEALSELVTLLFDTGRDKEGKADVKSKLQVWSCVRCDDAGGLILPQCDLCFFQCST